MVRLASPVFAGVRNERAAASLLAAKQGQLSTVMLDATSADKVDASFQQLIAARDGPQFGAVVNNAGSAVSGPLEVLDIQASRGAARGPCGRLVDGPRPGEPDDSWSEGGKLVCFGSLVGKGATPVSSLSDVIECAQCSPRPHARDPVGRDAAIASLPPRPLRTARRTWHCGLCAQSPHDTACAPTTSARRCCGWTVLPRCVSVAQ